MARRKATKTRRRNIRRPFTKRRKTTKRRVTRQPKIQVVVQMPSAAPQLPMKEGPTKKKPKKIITG